MKKIKIFILLVVLIFTLASCGIVTLTTSTSPTKKENIINIVNTLNDKVSELKFEENFFTVADLPIFDDEAYYFSGYSLNNDNNYLSNDTVYSITNDLTLYAKFGIRKDSFKINSIGKIFITTNDAITSKEDYVEAKIQIEDTDYQLYDESIQIRLRGNSSLGVPTKYPRLTSSLITGNSSFSLLLKNLIKSNFMKNKMYLDLVKIKNGH